jgi:hypothetical protein
MSAAGSRRRKYVETVELMLVMSGLSVVVAVVSLSKDWRAAGTA